MWTAFVALTIGAMQVGISYGQTAPPATLLEAGSAPAAPAAAAEPFYARSQRFGLPIQLYNAPFQIAAIQMYVSTDRGATWQLYGQQLPTAREFLFQAPRDGEYWFASKTLDDRNVVRPAGPPAAEQRIVVDTQEPAVDLQVEPGQSGEVRLSWKATDPYLNPRTLRVEYRAGVGVEWFPIPELPNSNVVGKSLEGQFVWWPQVTTRALEIRIEASDLAGNKGVATRPILLTKLTGRPATEGDPKRFVQNRPMDPRESTAGGVPWPANNQLSATPATTGDVPTQPPTVPNGSPLPNSVGHGSGPGQFVSSTSPTGPSTPTDPAPSVSPDANPMGDGPPSEPAGTVDPWPAIPAGQVLRMTTSRRFQLEYDVESTGQGEVSEIQLWGTLDGGGTWQKWDKDEDKQSPFDVQVDRDGIYGFRVVVLAANGMAGEVPRSGAPADLWVGVDGSRPTGEITGVIYGTGPRVGQLDIRWAVRDEKLGERPIGLSFSAQPSGPWTPIASGLPDTGQYFWKVDASVPPQVFLRLEIRDAAGNDAESFTREPINVEGLVPKAQIRDLRSR